MLGLLKIGHSTRPPDERAKELSSVTGVPAPFAVAFEEMLELSVVGDAVIGAAAIEDELERRAKIRSMRLRITA